MKRISAVLPMLLAMTLFYSASAEGTDMTLNVQRVQTSPGSVVTVDISAENNPGIWGMQFSLSYDASVLTAVKAEPSELFQDVITDIRSGEIVYSFTSPDFDNRSGNGSIMTVTFSVNSAAAGTYPIKITAEDGNIIAVDSNTDAVDISTVLNDGAVTVVGSTAENTAAGSTAAENVATATDAERLTGGNTVATAPIQQTLTGENQTDGGTAAAETDEDGLSGSEKLFIAAVIAAAAVGAAGCIYLVAADIRKKKK